MKNFERGEIYLANLPSTIFTDIVTAPSPIVEGQRFVVLLHNSDDINFDHRQVLIAPIIKREELGEAPLLPTHIELPENAYDFLEGSNLIATHQIMPINRDWLNNSAVGNISSTEYNDKMDIGIVTSVGLWNLIEEYVKLEAEQQGLQYAKKVKNDDNTHNSSPSSSKEFLRGHVFYAQLPRQEFDNGSFPPSYTIQGEHMVVVLHNSTSNEFDEMQVLVAPITSAKAAVDNNKIQPTHVQLLPTDGAGVKRECYISTHQIMPINREWLDNKKGKLKDIKMLEVDLAIAISGSLNLIINEERDKRLLELTKKY